MDEIVAPGAVGPQEVGPEADTETGDIIPIDEIGEDTNQKKEIWEQRSVA